MNLVHHSESSSTIQQELGNLRAILANYDLADTYNMDETELFYQTGPRLTLATKDAEIVGFKTAKDRISAFCWANGTGSQRLPLWIVGKLANPRCFKNVRLDTLGVLYRYNKKAWCTTIFMLKYLPWFNRKMITLGKKAVLILDNFKPYNLAAEVFLKDG